MAGAQMGRRVIAFEGSLAVLRRQIEAMVGRKGSHPLLEIDLPPRLASNPSALPAFRKLRRMKAQPRLEYRAFALQLRHSSRHEVAFFIFTDIATIFVSSEGFRHPYHDFTVRSDLQRRGFH
jgi:hypothetical protein